MGGSGWPDRVGGLIGCGEVLPEPVVLGDLMPPFGVIPVVAKELLLAVLVPWLIPAITTNAISTTTAIPATSPKGRRCSRPAATRCPTADRCTADRYNADQSCNASFGSRRAWSSGLKTDAVHC